MNNSERDALSLSLTSGSQAAQDACKSAQADKKVASLKASSMTPGGFRSLSAKITPWRPDLTKCHVCEAKFTLFNHRHSCRKCQEPVCNKCSRARKVLRRYAPPKRVCDPCVNHFWAIKTREPDAAAAAGATTNNSSSDISKTGGDPRLSLTVSAPSSSALAGGMYASHTASLSPGTPAAAFFGPNTTDMNRGRRRLGSTSVESCLSLGTPSMLPPPTPAGGEGDAAVAPPPPQEEEQALPSPVIMKEEEESGTFFGGRRESCGGGEGGAATPASLLVQDMGDFKSEMAAAGASVTAAVLAADAEAAAEAASSSVSASRGKDEVKAKVLGVEATPSSPRGVVVASKEVKNAVVVVVEAVHKSTSTVGFVGRASLEGVPDGGVEESKSGTPEELPRSGETNMTEAEKGARRSSGGDEIRPVSSVQAEKKAPPAEEKISVEGILHEGDAGKTEEQVKAELESEVAPVASVAESLVGSVVGSVAGDDELDDIEDLVDDKFVMPTVSAAASALAEAVSAAATAALLPAVLEEEPAPESVAAAAAAAVAVLVEAKNKGGGGKTVAPADVVVDKVAKDDASDGKGDGGGRGMVRMKTLACCGAVAFGVGLAVAVIVRSKW